jgi:hypothetical protein
MMAAMMRPQQPQQHTQAQVQCPIAISVVSTEVASVHCTLCACVVVGG